MALPVDPRSVSEPFDSPETQRAGVPAAEHARLSAETEERLRETETLLAVGRIFASTASVPEAMRQVTRVLARAFQADMGGAYSHDSTKDALLPIAGYHVPKHLVPTMLEAPFPIARFTFLREACETGKPVWTGDYSADDRFDQSFLAASRPRTLLFVPTAVRGEIVGGLFLVWWSVARGFTPSELRLVEGIASQVGLALENADLIRQMQDRLRETEILTELARAVNATLDLDVVLERIVDGTRELCAGDMAAVALREPGSAAMRMKHRVGYRYDGYDALLIEPGRGLGGTVLATGRPFRTENYADDPRLSQHYLEAILTDGTISQMAVPVWIEGAVQGLLYVSNRSPRPFTDRDEAVLQRLADHAAIAIRNARLYEEQTIRAARLRTLSRLNQIVSSSLHVDDVLGEIARAAATLMSGTVVSISTAHQSTRTVEVRAFSDDAIGADFPVRTVAFGEGLLGWVAAHRQPLHVPDAIADGRSSAPRWWVTHGLRSFYGIPIVHEGDLIGVLTLNGRVPFIFGADERELLDGFVAQAAVAIRNARLYDQSEQRRHTAEALAEVSRVLAQELDPDLVSQRIADSVRGLLTTRVATVFSLEPGSGALVARAISGDGDISVWRNAVVPKGAGAATHAVAELRPVAIPDMLADPRVGLPPEMRARIEQEGNGAVLAVPLVVKGRVIGALSVRDRTGRVFDDDEIRLAQAFADQAAVTLENARLYAEAEAAVQALRASEEQYRALVQGSIQGMYIHADRVIRLVNASMVRTFGYDSPEELIGQDYLIFIAPDERPRIEGYRSARLRSEDAPTRYEAQGITKDGRPIWIEILVSLIPWDGTSAVLGTFIDITERKRVEAAERDAVALRSVTQLANAAAHEINNPLAVIVGNLHMLALELDQDTGAQARVGKARLAADRIRDIVSRMAHITRLKTAEASPQLPVRLDLLESSRGQPAQEPHLPLAPAKRETDAAAAAEYLRVRMADLERRETARQREEHEWRERYALLEHAQAVAHVGHWISGLAGSPRLVWSRETCRIFGLDQGSFDGRVETFFSLVHRDDLEAVRRLSQLALGGQVPYSIDHRIVWPDGTVRWVHEEAEILRDPEGRPVRMLGVVQDITERKQAEELRGELEEQLRQAHRMEAVGALAGGIAHDFNNLLTIVAGRVKLLGARLRIDPSLDRDLAIIERTAQRATELTRQLLGFSRKQLLQPKVVDLNEIVATSAAMLRSVIGEHIDLTSVPGVRLGRVRVDPGQIEQVIMNLAVNARDAMPDGGRLIIETGNAELDAAFAAQPPGTRPGSYVRLTVSDTGIGMDPRTLSRIFEPFFTTKEAGKGTGLGLSTAYGIVTQHAGAITVDSAPGQGTTFRIYLPRVEDTADPAAPPGVPAPVLRGTETILLVEDEQGVRELVQEILEENGYRVLEARHPGEALLIGERYSGPIDLLVTDFAMPQMDGLELAGRIRSLRPAVRVLYVSAYADPLRDRDDIRHRLAPLLEKPFMPDVLARRVREVLDATPAG